MGVWNHNDRRIPVDKVLVGVIGAENQKRPNTYRFTGVGSGHNECFDIADAMVLSPDVALDGSGKHAKPTQGSPAVALLGPGGACFIVGFYTAPKVDLQSEEAPKIGDAGDKSGQYNYVEGDRVWFTSGGAAVVLKRGGSLIVQGGPGVSTQWLKETNTISHKAQNITALADGFRSTRGRIKIGKTDPETISADDYFDQVGTSATRVRIRHGHLENDGRRELTVSKLTYAGGQVTGQIKNRETYYDDGSWVGEGQKYQFGGKGADEKALLGNKVVDMLKDLLDILQNLKVNTAWGPSAVPVADTIAKIKQLQADYIDSGKILSDYIFLTKKPASPGTVNE